MPLIFIYDLLYVRLSFTFILLLTLQYLNNVMLLIIVTFNKYVL